jgi:hypothetical protein
MSFSPSSNRYRLNIRVGRTIKIIMIKRRGGQMIDIAYAYNGNNAVGVSGFVPLLLMGVMFGLLLKTIAKRKGKHEWLWFFYGFIPAWNLLGGIWLASLPDMSLYGEIDALANVLRKHGLMPEDEEKGASQEEIKSDTS